MGDEFYFSERPKRPARTSDMTSKDVDRSFDRRLIWISVGLVLAGVLAFLLVRDADRPGQQISGSQQQAVSEIDRAHDAAAQATIGRAVVAALSLHAESGSFTTDLATLSAYDPGVGFTSSPSKGPETISYAVDAAGFGAAVRSESGTCWWARIDASGVTTYGSGTPCTGNAAMAASAASW